MGISSDQAQAAESVSVPPIAPGWRTWREAVRLCARRAQVRRTLKIALIVGTILSLINQSNVILDGDATVTTWLRVGANYIVPYCVATAGFLTGTRVKRPEP